MFDVRNKGDKPVVGLLMDTKQLFYNPRNGKLDSAGGPYISHRWAEALTAFGFDVLYIVPDKNTDDFELGFYGPEDGARHMMVNAKSGKNLDQIFPYLDAVMLPGSESNHSPEFYGGKRSEINFLTQDIARDHVSMCIAHYASESKMPLLGVCRGAQSMNVSRLGTLNRDVQGHRKIGVPIEKLAVDAHPLLYCANSLMAQWAGATEENVNSIHGQGVEKLGYNLEVLARAPDGVVEAYHDPDHPFWVGLQFHPEFDPSAKPLYEAIFKNLYAAAQGYSEQRAVAVLALVDEAYDARLSL